MTHADPFNIEATPHDGDDALSRPDEAPPAFALIDDAGGRFVIDAQSGVVSVAHEDIVARERDAIHSARLRIVEPSGARYEIAMRLKITGLVPRMAGDDFFADAEADSAPHPTAVVEATTSPEPVPFSLAHWLHYAAFAARDAQHRARANFADAYGAALPGHVTPQVKAGRADLAVPAASFYAMPDAWLQDR